MRREPLAAKPSGTREATGLRLPVPRSSGNTQVLAPKRHAIPVWPYLGPPIQGDRDGPATGAGAPTSSPSRSGPDCNRRRSRHNGVHGSADPSHRRHDDPEVSRSLAHDLRQQYGQDYRIRRAESGPEALEALKELKLRDEKVGLLLADHRMPEMTGEES